MSVGECIAKKSVGQAPLQQRHAVIEQACQEEQPLSLRHLCKLGPRQSRLVLYQATRLRRAIQAD